MNDNTSPDGATSDTPPVAWWALAVAVAALLIGLVALLVAIGSDDDAAPVDSGAVSTAMPPVTDPAATSIATTPPPIAPEATDQPATIPATPTTASTTISPTPTTMLPPTTVSDTIDQAIWPRPGSDIRYSDPVDAARAFAVDLIGFDPVIVGDFLAGDSRSGDVEILSRPNGTPTVVHVRQVDNDWAVIGASNANITVTQPTALAEIASPMMLTGSATAFEGTVDVRLYSDGSEDPIVEGFVTGSGGPEPGPFGEIFEWTEVTSTGATLVMTSTSPETGSVVDAAAVRLRFRDVAV
jgi:hypothetical protein